MRAKFKVEEITQFGPSNNMARKVIFSPVTTGSEENKSFSTYTPSGKIELTVTNPDLKLEFGEYYIDFTKAE
jgi:hypothetical protein